ncbi:hypothetical protein [Microbacterium sp. NPDC058389]|uniref:hypothetical protein n=1 Tax=Microbacterium sp. NPDC058389 TaxID=3346475 RepID=UPI0036645E2A
MRAETTAAPVVPAPASSDRRLPPWAAWTIGVSCIVAAWFAALVTPGTEEAQAPFEVPASIGETVTGRNLVVTVTDLRRASEVSAHGWTAEGNWLVVDLDARSVLTEHLTSLTHTELVIDGIRFGASDRPDSLAENGALAIGIPREGSLAFELPADLDTGAGRIELSLSEDPSLDSMIVLSFDLGGVPAVDQTELLTTGWANP